MGWLIVPFTKFARRFDDHQDDILDKLMCSEYCPCWKSPQLTEEKDGKTVRTDAYAVYKSLPEKYLKQFGRVWDGDQSSINKPFVWDKDKSSAYTSFMQCFEKWQEKAKDDSSIDLYEIFKVPALENDEANQGVPAAI